MPCSGCGKDSPGGRARRGAQADRLFDAGRVRAAQRYRWQQCGRGNRCGLACENLDKEAGHVPACIDAETRRVVAADLYAALKRPEFHCPREQF